MEGFSWLNEAGSMQFSSDMTTISLIRKGTISSSTLFETDVSDELLAIRLVDGVSIQFRTNLDGIMIIPSIPIDYYVFSLKRAVESSARYGLQLYSAEGTLQYCAINDSPLNIIDSFDKPDIQGKTQTVGPIQNLDNYAFAINHVSSTIKLVSGSSTNPGVRHSFTQYVPVLKRSGNYIELSELKLPESGGYFDSFASNGTFGRTGIQGLIVDVNVVI